MLIQTAQIEHFAMNTRERFITMMASYLQRAFPALFRHQDNGAVIQWVRQGLAVCEKYGVITEPEAAQCILILLGLGLEAAEPAAWAGEALAYDGAPVGKLRRLVDICRARGTPINEMLVFDSMFTDER